MATKYAYVASRRSVRKDEPIVNLYRYHGESKRVHQMLFGSWWDCELSFADLDRQRGEGALSDFDKAVALGHRSEELICCANGSDIHAIRRGHRSAVTSIGLTSHLVKTGPWQQDPLEWWSVETASVDYCNRIVSVVRCVPFTDRYAAVKHYLHSVSNRVDPNAGLSLTNDEMTKNLNWAERVLSVNDKADRKARAAVVEEAKKPTEQLSNVEFSKIFRHHIRKEGA